MSCFNLSLPFRDSPHIHNCLLYRQRKTVDDRGTPTRSTITAFKQSRARWLDDREAPHSTSPWHPLTHASAPPKRMKALQCNRNKQEHRGIKKEGRGKEAERKEEKEKEKKKTPTTKNASISNLSFEPHFCLVSSRLVSSSPFSLSYLLSFSLTRIFPVSPFCSRLL